MEEVSRAPNKKAKRPPTAKKRKRTDKPVQPKPAQTQQPKPEAPAQEAGWSLEKQAASARSQMKEIARIVERIRRADEYLLFDRKTVFQSSPQGKAPENRFAEGQVLPLTPHPF